MIYEHVSGSKIKTQIDNVLFKHLLKTTNLHEKFTNYHGVEHDSGDYQLSPLTHCIHILSKINELGIPISDPKNRVILEVPSEYAEYLFEEIEMYEGRPIEGDINTCISEDKSMIRVYISPFKIQNKEAS